MIGSQVCLSEPDFWSSSTREEIFSELRREGAVLWQDEPVTEWSPGGRGYWAVIKHQEGREVSRRPDLFVSGLGTELFELPPALGEKYSFLLNMDGLRHSQMRSITTTAFSPRRVALLEPLVRTHATALIAKALEAGSVDFASAVSEALSVGVICELLGVPEADRREVARLSRVSVPLGDVEFGDFEDALDAAFQLIEYSKPLQQERRKRPRDDLLSELVHAKVEGRHLSPDEVGSYFELLITAGIETSSSAVSQGLVALARNPDQWDLLRRDFARLVPSAVEEILRWSTPVIHFRRTATAETKVGSQTIRAGDKVVMFFHSANRDESVFDLPYRFDIRRVPNPHLAFGGGGRHMCLGAHLGRLEIRVVFEELARRVSDLSGVGEPFVAHSMFLTSVKSLPVQLGA